ncbi:L,D-transpeptidase [Clostridium peptidivorans]|uniref:L,D-transpeptidase n=1 Tax=Clostridium peptidivorans TaxID=100174 RepID=UPI0015C69A32|nr:L,D-transpeptidase [Clostridium peptidivorans]
MGSQFSEENSYFRAQSSYRQGNYGIVINTKNLTLTLYSGNNVVKTYPVAVGKPSTPTPLGNFTIVNKIVNPGGPFGVRWMGLSIPHYGIHGTNNPASIGTRASHGCIRMYNKDVLEIFNKVSIGTPVQIINQ